MLRAYLSYINDLDSTRYERIRYHIRHVQEANILSIMFDVFDERTLRTIMFAMFNKRTRRAIYIFLIYRKLKMRLFYKSCSIYLKSLFIVTIIKVAISCFQVIACIV